MKFLTVALTGLLSLSLSAHDSSDHSHHNHDHSNDTKPTQSKTKLVTGQGEFVFSWDEELTGALPEAAKKFEPKMHGGFNEDPETGIVYTGIPGYGLCSISNDLKTWKLLGDDKRLKDNIHGIVCFSHKGKKLLAMAQQGKRVLITDLEGKVVGEVGKPKGTEFDFEPANAFFGGKKSNFGITDVTYLNGTIYAAHGYSKGDFIMTIVETDGKWAWGKLAWGGKGKKPGQFNTAHGILAHEGHIYVGNRESQQVVKFTPDGKFVSTFKDIPAGSRVCNVAYLKNHFFLCPLVRVNKSKSAPIYAHTGDKLVSTIIPGDLNIPVLNNIHHAWPHYVRGKDGSKKLYILVHGWNKGKYAVLKHEEK